jgi:exonuclease III
LRAAHHAAATLEASLLPHSVPREKTDRYFAMMEDLSRRSFAAYRKLVDQGWTDSLRTLFPDKPMYTFWDYKRQRWERDAGLRIDHLLLSPPLAGQLRKGGVDRAERGRQGASDHAPAWIELR